MPSFRQRAQCGLPAPPLKAAGVAGTIGFMRGKCACGSSESRWTLAIAKRSRSQIALTRERYLILGGPLYRRKGAGPRRPGGPSGPDRNRISRKVSGGFGSRRVQFEDEIRARHAALARGAGYVLR
ncbi:hypothetical protein EVAR_91408_1 [Eumeta japonica]|uniref:Uncharacterized protein n=1 Tax=Eumeta variegata TaxID=151549 RepID=A0A4C1XBL4_EUMVA|nr:hypothetical protein EVAR_91408_1 [Eumeta japonica]